MGKRIRGSGCQAGAELEVGRTRGSEGWSESGWGGGEREQVEEHGGILIDGAGRSGGRNRMKLCQMETQRC